MFSILALMGVLIIPSLFASDKIFEPQAIQILERIPVQHGGRIKPFKSYAQETLLYLTNKIKWKEHDTTALMFQWMAEPAQFFQEPILPVSLSALREEMGLRVIDKRVSGENVISLSPLVQKARESAARKEKNEKLLVLDEKRLELYNRASYFQEILHHNVPGMVPNPHRDADSWLAPHYLISQEGRQSLSQLYPPPMIEAAAGAFENLLAKIKQGKAVTAEDAAALEMALNGLFQSSNIALDHSLIQKEVLYLNLRPFHWAWIFYLTSFALIFFGGWKAKAIFNFLSTAGLVFFILAEALHIYGIYLRVVIAGRPPVSNMYESMIWVSLVAAFIAGICFAVYRSFLILKAAGLVTALVLVLAENFPVVFSPAIDTLVPVLRSNLWLTVHVLTITMSYGAFALAWGLAHFILLQMIRQPKANSQITWSTQLLHRILMVGVTLLAAGTILGGVWANYSWGRFWGWDPKETWALIALLGYVAVLHGRFAGWFGNFGLAAGSVIAFLGIVMAWYGVNYVLAAGLHSYGFGGGDSLYVLVAAGLDLLFVISCFFQRQKKSIIVSSK